MKLILQRDIFVNRWRVVATIGFNQNRPELIAILALTKELPDGLVSGRDVSSRLLAGRPESVGDRLLSVCRMMKLIESVPERKGLWSLTPLGERAMMKKEVPVPQRGEFELWTIDDPLFPDAIVRTRATELEHQSSDENKNVPPSEGIPHLLRRCVNQVIAPPVRFEGEANEICVFEISEKCRASDRVSCRVKLEIDESGGWAIFSTMDRTFSTTPELPTLAEALSQVGWRGSETVKSVSFRYLSDSDRRSGSKDESLGNVHLRELGDFETGILKDVRLVPKIQSDADEWAEWRLRDKIKGYVWPEDYENMVRAAREVSVKQGWQFDPLLPSQSDLARKIADNSQAQRWLLVPLEWGTLRRENDIVRHTILVISGRATSPDEVERILDECGRASNRVFILLPENENAKRLGFSNEIQRTCVIRRVRQPPDTWVWVEPGKWIGRRWVRSEASDSVKNKKSEAGKERSSGSWLDLQDLGFDDVIQKLRRAFWKNAREELDVQGNWIAVKQK
ncbi:MAG: hypothetical protein NUW37_03680 [Planctomycetes bacterium]|nr:hypothetical protein [Planctomycetota bacterium]